MNKTHLRDIEIQARELINLYSEEDDDKFVLQSLDKYLKIALESEILEQNENEVKINEEIHQGCTKQ